MSEQVAINTNAPHIVKRFWVAVALLGALLIGAAVLLLSLSAADMFERQVYPDRAIAEKLQTGQAACMHCPWYFRFESSPEAIRAILARVICSKLSPCRSSWNRQLLFVQGRLVD